VSAVSSPWRHGAVPFGPTPSSGWQATKILWIASPMYRKSVEVTVGDEARFADFDVDGNVRRTYGSIVILGGTKWRDLPSTLVVRRWGCVSFRVSGPGMRRTITIRTAI
jgi:hypothetical protein